MGGGRGWTGATPTRSASFSDCPATPCWQPRSRLSPMRCAHGGQSMMSTRCATGPRHAMARSLGPDHVAFVALPQRGCYRAKAVASFKNATRDADAGMIFPALGGIMTLKMTHAMRMEL